ncbi:MAG: indolepyruvate ferredoxin oxidoreductase subunit alpha [Christensenellaceae bacterium]|nr:indolepyruvate ferredoxin oxidoreductase subunit alpha [Christensenellaceae bacterium]
MKTIMLGNEAFARGAYEAGVTVVASYPGTPSTEITECTAKMKEIHSEWAPNEKVAVEVAVGASVGGARALSCMKHVGLNVAADPVFTASYTGVNGGLVILVADDPSMPSSQNEQDSRFYARSSHIPMLEPSDSQEAKDFMIRAYELSEKFDTPFFMRSTTRISHSRGIVETGERIDYQVKDYESDPAKYVMMPNYARLRHVFVEQRMKDIKEFAFDCDLNRIEMNDTAIGIVTSGVCYQYVKEACPDASVLKLGMVYPINTDLIKSFAEKVDKLYIVEELEPFIENQCKAAGIKCTGKELFTVQGEYSANMVKESILGIKTEGAKAATVPARPPALCPGCPHRAVFYTLKSLKLKAFGDIGCYTLGAVPPLSSIDTTVCMGASIGMAHGAEMARGGEFAAKSVAVIGDSTFLHSGITGLLNTVYNAGTSTVIILDNSTTGMTGHQDHPGTGKNAMGEMAPAVDIVKLADALGVKNIRVIDPFDLKGLKAVLKEETSRREPSLIVTRRPCILLDKKNIHPAFKENTDKCKNCGMCMKLGCPAICKTEKGIAIDATLCTGCGLCADVCAFDAIEAGGDK